MSNSKARLLAPTDNLEIAETLARAFQTETGWSYVIPDPKLRAQRLAGAFHLFLQDEHRKGAVFGTDGIEAVTLWRGPGQAHDSLWDRARLIIPFIQRLRFSIFRGLEVADLIEKHLPKEPVWYLQYAGCDPAHQGKGFGGAAIRAGLERADEDGLPAYLETADEHNVALYQSFGFQVKHMWQVPEGPQFWGMQRPGKTRH
ncbi:GNAT family N-acetyltransferase [Sphingorhabdus lacus]|uniref:GNAT family N-acetyltransferase n=1 Tax=Sphingorhabdus lacus TaxID=392610 RepID=UPI0035942FE9